MATGTGNGTFQPIMILVGTRLGIDRVNPVYWEALKASLQMPQSLGIAGGRPSSSHYFIGVQGNNYFYLDPHSTRPALPFHEHPSAYTVEDIESCHTRRLRRLNITEMDPSMLIAFLIKDENDWHDWRSRIARSADPGQGQEGARGKAVIHIADTEPIDMQGKGSERPGAVDEVEILSEDEEEDADGVKVDVEESDNGRVEALDDLERSTINKAEPLDDGDGVEIALEQSNPSVTTATDEGDGVKIDLAGSDLERSDATDESDGVKV
jgi:hypothetical protein